MTHSCCNLGKIKYITHKRFLAFYVRSKSTLFNMMQILKIYFGSFELLAKQIRVQLTQMQNVGFELQLNMK